MKFSSYALLMLSCTYFQNGGMASTPPASNDEAEEAVTVVKAILPSTQCHLFQMSNNQVQVQIDAADFLPETNIIGGDKIGFPKDHSMSTNEFLMFTELDQFTESTVKIHIEFNSAEEYFAPLTVQTIVLDGKEALHDSLERHALRLEGSGSFSSESFDGPCSVEFDIAFPSAEIGITSNYDCSQISKADYDQVIDDALVALQQFQKDYSDLTPEKAIQLGMDKDFVEKNKDKIKLEGGEIAGAAEKLAGLITACKQNCLKPDEMAAAASQLLIKLAPLANIAFPGAGTVLEVTGSVGLVLAALLGERSDSPPPVTAKMIEDAAARAMRNVLAERDEFFLAEISQLLKDHSKIYGSRQACIRKYQDNQEVVDEIIDDWFNTGFYGVYTGTVGPNVFKLGEIYHARFSSKENTPRKNFLVDQVQRDCRKQCMGDLASGSLGEWDLGRFQELFRMIIRPINGKSGFEQCEEDRVAGETLWRKLKSSASSFLVAANEVQLWSSVVISILQKHSNKNKYAETIKLIRRDMEHHGKRSFALTALMTEKIPATCGLASTSLWPYEIQKCQWDPRQPGTCNYPAILSIAKNLEFLSPQGIPEIHWRTYANIDSQLGPDCTAYRNANGDIGFGSGMTVSLSHDDHWHRAFPHGKDHCGDAVWWSKKFPASGSLYAIPNFCMNAGATCDNLFLEDSNWGL